jgi:hypothetical protein
LAKTVYDSEDITLQDGREVTLVPLAIGRLRRFMKAWGEFANIENEDDAFDIYINCCGIALEKSVEADFNNTKDAEKVISDDYREYLEDVLDMDTIYKVLEVCGGLKLNDPKLLEQAEALAEQQAAAGTS